MSALHEAARRVVAAWTSTRPAWVQECNAAVLALDAALKALPEPQDAELSAALGWPGGISDPVLDRKVLLQKVAALKAEPAQEPVGWMDPTDGSAVSRARREAWERDFGLAGKGKAATFTVPLYTAPQPQRPLLTDEEINEIAQTNLGDYRDGEWHLLFARAIERKLKGE